MKIIKDCNLANFNSYRLDAVCRVAYFPENEEDIAVVFSKEKNPILLGSGHNVILSKRYYDEAFVIFNGNYNECYLLPEDKLVIQAGLFTKQLVELALEYNLTGLEVFYDIPSSVGGAIVMNAGANGEEIGNLVCLVRCYDVRNRCFVEYLQKDCGFVYRNSRFQNDKNLIVSSVTLQLQSGIKEHIREKMDLIKAQRVAKQPKEYPNAGSVFKRPNGRFVGPMLDELELKGYTVGGAQVSQKHSGFIVNVGGATGQDVLQLIEYIQSKVRDRFGVDLEVEQRII